MRVSNNHTAKCSPLRRAAAAAAALAAVAAAGYAQEVIPLPPEEGATVLLGGANFWVSIAAGVVLALAFQMFLTLLSGAAGLNMLSGVTRPESAGRQGRESSQEGKGASAGSTARKISGAFGAWTLVTASLSLFFASWIGARLGLAVTAFVGAAIGLVIWGLFYLVTMTLEVSAVSSLFGSLARVASGGFRSAYQAASSIFGKSPEDRVADAATQITASVRDELFGDQEDFQESLQSYINQLKPKQMDPETIGREIAGVLNDTEIKTVTSEDGRKTFIRFMEQEGRMTKDKAEAVASGVQGAYSKAKEQMASGKRPSEKAADTLVGVAAGKGGAEAQAYRQKLEQYLRSTGKGEFNPEGIKRDIEKLLSDPKGGAQALKERASHIDRNDIASLLAQRKDMSPDEARRLVDRVDSVLGEITGKAKGAAESAQGAQGGMEAKLRDYLNSTGQPELRYEGIKHDLMQLFRDPKQGFDSLVNRFKAMDRDSIKALLASRKDISDRDAERIVGQVEGTRDELVQKAEQMKAEVDRRVEQAKAEALRQADEARKTAAAAAWWVVGTAVVSAVAAVLGGVVGSVNLL